MPPALDTHLDEEHLERLLSELGARARTRRFEAAPNPCVGAAVLAGGALIALMLKVHPAVVIVAALGIGAIFMR